MKLDDIKRNASPIKRDDDTRLIPLINIVFLLLIFVMLAGSLSQPGAFDVTPPESSSLFEADIQTLIVVVSAQGRLAVGEDELEMPALTQLLSERLSATPDLPIQLKADGDLAAETLLEVMDVIQSTGVSKLTLLTVTGKR